MLETKVYDFLVKRGYGVGDSQKILYVQKQVIKCLEELGEVARYAFDGNYPPGEELADVAIPILATCAVLGLNFEEEVLRKVESDVSRGIRTAGSI